MKTYLFQLLRTTGLLTTASLLCAALVHADATIEQKMTLDVASMIRMHGESTTSITPDKKREDSASHCEGVMSMLCGNLRHGEIIRLDRNLTWQLEPGKKRYREQAFATPAELTEMRAKMQANLEKMRSCPVSQKQQPIDKSKCQMSAPKIDVHKTDNWMSIAGHHAQLTRATLTESCTDKDNGDVCDTVIAADIWLTPDKLPDSADRGAFDQAYAKRLGLDESSSIMHGEVAKFLAAYQSQIKQLADKSNELKGQPLQTSLRVLIGGPQCRAVAQPKNGDASNPDSPSSSPIANVQHAGKALGSSVGNLVGGLFHKKKGDDSQAAADTAPATAAAPITAATDPLAQLLQMAAFTTETVSINVDAIPADRFDVPADWKKEEPKAAGSVDEFTCPNSGN